MITHGCCTCWPAPLRQVRLQMRIGSRCMARKVGCKSSAWGVIDAACAVMTSLTFGGCRVGCVLAAAAAAAGAGRVVNQLLTELGRRGGPEGGVCAGSHQPA